MRYGIRKRSPKRCGKRPPDRFAGGRQGGNTVARAKPCHAERPARVMGPLSRCHWRTLTSNRGKMRRSAADLLAGGRGATSFRTAGPAAWLSANLMPHALQAQPWLGLSRYPRDLLPSIGPSNPKHADSEQTKNRPTGCEGSIILRQHPIQSCRTAWQTPSLSSPYFCRANVSLP